jgi:hypothetical protein
VAHAQTTPATTTIDGSGFEGRTKLATHKRIPEMTGIRADLELGCTGLRYLVIAACHVEVDDAFLPQEWC